MLEAHFPGKSEFDTRKALLHLEEEFQSRAAKSEGLSA